MKDFYHIHIPANSLTQDPTHLEIINTQSNGYQYLLNGILDIDKFEIGDNLWLTRNISPHGIGGLLLWDFESKNLFHQSDFQSKKYIETVGKILDILEGHYGSDYHVIMGMATSENPGLGKSQSIAYTHVHFTLLPRNISEEKFSHHGITYTKGEFQLPSFSLDIPKISSHKDGTIHPFGYLFSFLDIAGIIDFIFQLKGDDYSDEISRLLSAPHSFSGKLFGSQWCIFREKEQFRLGIIPGGSYFYMFGSNIHRDSSFGTNSQEYQELHAFNHSIFHQIQNTFLESRT